MCLPAYVQEAAASQPLLQFDLGLNLSIKKIGKREFLEQMQQVVS